MNLELKIMVVDDDPISMEFARCSLEDLGFKKVYQAVDGSEALTKLVWGEIDLVISDWNMPRIDGLELFKRMRKIPSHKNIPFMLMTSSSEKEKVMEVLKAGITHFIVKPFELETLKTKIESIFKQS